jgi:hypothetical protein
MARAGLINRILRCSTERRQWRMRLRKYQTLEAAATGDTPQPGSFYLKKTFILHWIAVYCGFDRMASKKFSACPPIESSFLTSLRFQVFTELCGILVSGDVQES